MTDYEARRSALLDQLENPALTPEQVATLKQKLDILRQEEAAAKRASS